MVLCFFSSFCTPELRTSGGTLTLFIFIDPLSVCVKKENTPPPTQHTSAYTNTHSAMHKFSSGAEQGEAAPDLSPVHLSLSLPDSPLMCSRKCHHASRKKVFFRPTPTPHTQTHISTHLAYEQHNLLSLTHPHHYLEPPPPNTTPLLPNPIQNRIRTSFYCYLVAGFQSP